MIKYCETCRFAEKSQNLCRLRNLRIDPTADYCSFHSDNAEHCDMCQNIVFKNNYLIEEDTNNKICFQCNEKMKTCQLCTQFSRCEFQTNSSTIPLYITETVQQGNMIVQKQIKNKERIEKFCLSCPCYEGDYNCRKDFGVACENIKFAWRES